VETSFHVFMKYVRASYRRFREMTGCFGYFKIKDSGQEISHSWLYECTEQVIGKLNDDLITVSKIKNKI